MSTFSGYKTKAFSETQKFFVLDPNTGSPAFVQGSDLIDQITPKSNYVYSESTRTTAQATDYSIGSLIQTSGAEDPGDNLASVYLVVASGEGDFPMQNGNELLVVAGDDILREQLAASPSAGQGATLVNGATTYVSDVQALIGLPDPEDGRHYETTAYHPGWAALAKGPIGGDRFVYDASRDKADHTGGDVIDPDKAWPDWTVPAEVTAWFTPAASGTGCYVSVNDESLNVANFGVREGAWDNSPALNKVFEVQGQSGYNVATPPYAGTYGGTKEVYFPTLKINIDNTVTVPAAHCSIRADRAVIVNESGSLATAGFDFTQAWIIKVEGLHFANLDLGVKMRSNNLNQGKVLFDDCHWHGGALAIDHECKSSITVFRSCKFNRVNKVIKSTGGDWIVFRDGWVQDSGILTSYDGTFDIQAGNLMLVDMLLVPLSNQDPAGVVKTAHVVVRDSPGGATVIADRTRFGGESGGRTIINWESEGVALNGGTAPSGVIIKNSYNSVEEVMVRLQKLPNFVILEDNHHNGNDYAIEFDERLATLDSEITRIASQLQIKINNIVPVGVNNNNFDPAVAKRMLPYVGDENKSHGVADQVTNTVFQPVKFHGNLSSDNYFPLSGESGFFRVTAITNRNNLIHTASYFVNRDAATKVSGTSTADTPVVFYDTDGILKIRLDTSTTAGNVHYTIDKMAELYGTPA